MFFSLLDLSFHILQKNRVTFIELYRTFFSLYNVSEVIFKILIFLIIIISLCIHGGKECGVIIIPLIFLEVVVLIGCAGLGSLGLKGFIRRFLSHGDSITAARWFIHRHRRVFYLSRFLLFFTSFTNFYRTFWFFLVGFLSTFLFLIFTVFHTLHLISHIFPS